jgi:hypothetical protein
VSIGEGLSCSKKVSKWPKHVGLELSEHLSKKLGPSPALTYSYPIALQLGKGIVLNLNPRNGLDVFIS